MKLIPSHNRAGFTMVEIALCLAIVGFALVAIIGVLPTGMNVQRDNRQETIINQDAAVWLDAIRSGAQGYNDLSNYLVSITNHWARFNTNGAAEGKPGEDWYTVQDASVTSVSGIGEDYAANDGYRIIGLLSTPKIIYISDDIYQSNYVVAYVRAMSGAAVEKMPQRNDDILRDAFTYRMILENTPYVPMESGTNEVALRTWDLLRENSRDLRLTFRWPVLPRGIGNGRQTYRQLVSGSMTNVVDGGGHPLHFIQPSTFVQLP